MQRRTQQHRLPPPTAYIGDPLIQQRHDLSCASTKHISPWMPTAEISRQLVSATMRLRTPLQWTSPKAACLHACLQGFGQCKRAYLGLEAQVQQAVGLVQDQPAQLLRPERLESSTLCHVSLPSFHAGLSALQQTVRGQHAGVKGMLPEAPHAAHFCRVYKASFAAVHEGNVGRQ